MIIIITKLTFITSLTKKNVAKARNIKRLNLITINLEQMGLKVTFEKRYCGRFANKARCSLFHSTGPASEMPGFRIVYVILWLQNQLEMRILELLWILEMNQVQQKVRTEEIKEGVLYELGNLGGRVVCCSLKY